MRNLIIAGVSFFWAGLAGLAMAQVPTPTPHLIPGTGLYNQLVNQVARDELRLQKDVSEGKLDKEQAKSLMRQIQMICREAFLDKKTNSDKELTEAQMRGLELSLNDVESAL